MEELSTAEAILNALETIRTAARDSESRLLSALHRASGYAVVMLDEQGRITLWNRGAVELFGWSEGEVMGNDYRIIFSGDDDSADVADQELARARTQGRTEEGRWFSRKDGSQFFGHELLMHLPDATIGGFVKILHDRTDARRMEQAWRSGEERLRLILERAVDYAIFTVDRDGFVTSWNSGAERLLGYREAEIINQDSRIIFTPEDRAHNAPELEINKALEEGRAENERWHVRKDGSRYWGSGLMMPLKAGERPSGLLKIMRDETERRRSDEMKQLLIDELNHRVNNTLATVQALAAQTLKTSPTSEIFAETFRGRVIALAQAHDLLTKEAWDMVALEDIVRTALSTWTETGRTAMSGPAVSATPKQALALRTDDECDEVWRPFQLGRPRRGRVDARCGAMRAALGGAGRPSCFASYQARVRIAGAESGAITGIGQPVLLNFEGAGVTCVLRFTSDGWQDACHRNCKGESMNQLNGNDAGGARVLVIEDEMLVAMMVEDLLSEAGYSVLGPVATVGNALSILEAGTKIDVAVMDLNLSGQTSLPLANVFREKRIPFMVITGYGSAPLSPPNESVRVLSKPFDPADLIAMLQKTQASDALPPTR